MSVIEQSPSLKHFDRRDLQVHSEAYTEADQRQGVELAAVVATISGIAALATGIIGILTLAH